MGIYVEIVAEGRTGHEKKKTLAQEVRQKSDISECKSKG